MPGNTIFSGEPLPLAPKVDDVELENFHRKLLDYLRRLTAKLQLFTGGEVQGGSLEVFAAWFPLNQIVGTEDTPVSWDNVLRKDAAYDHGPNSDITVTKPGLYVVFCDLQVASSADSIIELEMPGVALPGYPSYSATVETLGGVGSLSMAVSMPLITGVKMRVLVRGTGAGTTVFAAGSRITIIRFALDETGGTGVPPGTGYDPPGGPGGGEPPTWINLVPH